MPENISRLLRAFYKKNGSCLPTQQDHPDEEMLASYFEGKLPAEKLSRISEHLAGCALCAELFLVQARVAGGRNYPVSARLVSRLKNIAGLPDNSALEIILKSAEKVFELLYTNGKVLLGQELIPMPGLRSRNIKDFRDTVSIVKDIDNIRIEIKIDSCAKGYVNITAGAKNKKTAKLLKDYRISLIQSDAELESYVIDKTAVTFEHVLLGKYSLEISSEDSKLANVSVDIKL